MATGILLFGEKVGKTFGWRGQGGFSGWGGKRNGGEPVMGEARPVGCRDRWGWLVVGDAVGFEVVYRLLDGGDAFGVFV